MPSPRRAAPETAPVPAPEAPGRPPWRNLLGFGRRQILVALILLLTSLMVVMAIRSQASQGVYESMRREELVQLLDQASTETRRLEAEVADLRSTRDDLESGAAGVEAAEADARRRLDQLEILAGTVAVAGPGIELTIHDPERNVTPELLLNGIEELRDAGAEVIEFNGSIRLTAGSWLAMDEQGRILADGTQLTWPVLIRAIGDPATLEAGARFRGGLVSQVERPQVQGQVEILQHERIEITSVVEPRQHEHARPR